MSGDSTTAAMKRLHILVDDASIAERLYQKGIHSAIQIASLSRRQFVSLYVSDVFAGDEHAAELTWRRAMGRKTQVIHRYVALKTHAGAHYNASPFANLGPRREK